MKIDVVRVEKSQKGFHEMLQKMTSAKVKNKALLREGLMAWHDRFLSWGVADYQSSQLDHQHHKPHQS